MGRWNRSYTWNVYAGKRYGDTDEIRREHSRITDIIGPGYGNVQKHNTRNDDGPGTLDTS